MTEKILATIKNVLFVIAALAVCNTIILFLLMQKFSDLSVVLIGK